jgi:hypothetical protein
MSIPKWKEAPPLEPILGSSRKARTGCWRLKGLTGQPYDQVRRLLETVARSSRRAVAATVGESRPRGVRAVTGAACDALAERPTAIAKSRTEAQRAILRG